MWSKGKCECIVISVPSHSVVSVGKFSLPSLKGLMMHSLIILIKLLDTLSVSESMYSMYAFSLLPSHRRPPRLWHRPWTPS